MILLKAGECAMNRKCLPALAGVLCPLLFLSGCIITTDRTGPMQYDTRSFERGTQEELHLDLNMGAGDLKVGTGTRKLAQVYFNYNVAEWKPEVREDRQGTRVNLTIRQPGHSRSHFGSTKYEWDLRLSEDVPLYLHANFGAGQAQLDLGSLPVRDVDVNMGVGQLNMDLRGNPKHDYNVRIHGGVGEATVHLPANAGVYAEASGGIGSIEARNLRKESGHWVNDAYEHASVRIHVTVEGGVGEIRLIGE
jgi:predicted membrane protein